jgi:hypothetical protein
MRKAEAALWKADTVDVGIGLTNQDVRVTKTGMMQKLEYLQGVPPFILIRFACAATSPSAVDRSKPSGRSRTDE